MSKPSVGFYFNVQDWRGSRAVQRMSFAERGVYFEMLCEQWEKRNMPDVPQQVAELLSTTEAQAREVMAAWEVVRRKFVISPSDPSRIYNAALERTRRQQAANRRKKQSAGQRGGNAAAAKRLERERLEASSAIALSSNATAKHSEQNRIEENRTEENSSTDSRFARFWSAYPVKKAKDGALRQWRKRKPDDALLAQILAAIDRQKNSRQWKEGYVPYPARWLSEARWLDEAVQPVKAANVLEYLAWQCQHEPRCPSEAVCEIVSKRKAG
jgi:hypothetical protein